MKNSMVAKLDFNMEVLRLLMVFVLSGGTVVAITILSKVGAERWAGALVFAPIVSLWSFLYIGVFQGADQLRQVVANAMITAPSVLLYSVTLYFVLPSVHPVPAVLGAVLIWFFSAQLMLKAFQ